jgi:CheY-like chemotaxis protein/HPt (histidine-containing phosphotransfer) domain-containing protein
LSKGSAIQFDVIDTGGGISPEQINRISQPFEQGDSSTSRKYGGTGLGLAISTKLTELMGGELSIQSEFPNGSRFRLTLPTGPLEGIDFVEHPSEAGNDKPAPREIETPDLPLSEMNILLAEDGPDNQRLIQAFLKKAGATVTLVVNGKEAYEAAICQTFNLILMDMQMPEMDGYQATKLLRQKGYGNPIVALTAHALTTDREKCLASGCNDYITKPVNRATFIETVARYRTSVAKSGDSAGNTSTEISGVTPAISEFAQDEDLSGILDDFVSGLPGKLEVMREDLENGCFPQLCRKAHQLKGAGGGYGYPQLTAIARELESASVQEDREIATLKFREMVLFCQRIALGRNPRPVQ